MHFKLNANKLLCVISIATSKKHKMDLYSTQALDSFTPRANSKACFFSVFGDPSTSQDWTNVEKMTRVRKTVFDDDGIP